MGACSTLASRARWPEPDVLEGADASREHEAGGPAAHWVEQQPVCVSSKSWSAGTLGDTVLYRSRRVGRRVDVGYFVFWSTERPWGANFQSFTVLPALATDVFYSHFLYVFPGAKDVIYGPADIEGALVEYEEGADGSLRVLGGHADDGNHDPVELSRDDLLDSNGRINLLSDVWSHQLGAHGAAEFAEAPGHITRCYQGPSLQPLTTEVAQAFRMGDEAEPLRAKPAWLDPDPATKPSVQVASTRR
ncbi:MAG TPA: hypothetical protein VGI10_13775 [Polyangiaceae bacterium]